MEFSRDEKGQLCVEWQVGRKAHRRAWIQRNGTGGAADLANARRNLNVICVQDYSARSTSDVEDFPVYSDLPEQQILEAFVTSVCATSGTRSPRR